MFKLTIPNMICALFNQYINSRQLFHSLPVHYRLVSTIIIHYKQIHGQKILSKPLFLFVSALDIVYVPDTANITSAGVYFNEASSETLFERLWPPQLDTISLNTTSAIHMATIEVTSETDCAYRCYTLDECKTFSIACKSSSKCKLLFCKLLSGLDLQ